MRHLQLASYKSAASVTSNLQAGKVVEAKTDVVLNWCTCTLHNPRFRIERGLAGPRAFHLGNVEVVFGNTGDM